MSSLSKVLFNFSHSKIYIYIHVKLVTVVEGDPPKSPFLIASTQSYWGGRYSFPWIAPL